MTPKEGLNTELFEEFLSEVPEADAKEHLQKLFHKGKIGDYFSLQIAYGVWIEAEKEKNASSPPPPSPPKMKLSFGELLKTARKRQDLRIKDVARELGISAATYGSYEREGIIPKLNVYFQLCVLFEIPLTCFQDTREWESILDGKFQSIH